MKIVYCCKDFGPIWTNSVERFFLSGETYYSHISLLDNSMITLYIDNFLIDNSINLTLKDNAKSKHYGISYFYDYFDDLKGMRKMKLKKLYNTQ
jgi:hypothetical protein